MLGKWRLGGWDDHPIDFTWERAWRYSRKGARLPVYLHMYREVYGKTPIRALVVARLAA